MKKANMQADWKPDGDDWRVNDLQGFIGLVGPVWEAIRDEGPLFCFMASPKHENIRGVVQGGMLMTFLDRIMGATGRWHNGNRPQATVQLDVRFIRSVSIGSVVMGRAQVIRRTQGLIFLDGELQVNNLTVAAGAGVWKILGA